MIAAGKLRQRIVIQRPNTLDDYAPSGEQYVTWEGMPTPFVWGEVKQLTGTELIHAQQVQAQATHEVTMRYLPGIRETMRLLWGEKALNVLSVNDVEGRGVVLVLTCREAK